MAYGLLFDYLNGQCIEAYKYFGAHFESREVKEIITIPLKKDPTRTKQSSRKKMVEGVVFRLYAPCASDVSVIGDWNNWDPGIHKMNKVDESGVFEIFIEGLHNYSFYKYLLQTHLYCYSYHVHISVPRATSYFAHYHTQQASDLIQYPKYISSEPENFREGIQ